MEQGLAHQMTYGDGKGQNTVHYYAGAKKKKKAKSCGCDMPKKRPCKKGCGK